MSGFPSETIRLPAGRPASDALAGSGREGDPVVLRFPGRSRGRAEDSVSAADQPIRPLWIRGYRGKRTFDVVIGGLLAIALMPVAVLIGVVLVLRGRVLDRTVVVGSDGRNFLRLRFRTRGDLRSTSPGQGRESDGLVLPLYSAASVPRTRFGRFLHATGLERLPELWNVLKGDLALIGPAARTPDETDAAPQFPPRWDLKPGIVWVALAEPEHDAVIRYVATQGMCTDLQILAGACWRLSVRAIKASWPE